MGECSSRNPSRRPTGSAFGLPRESAIRSPVVQWVRACRRVTVYVMVYIHCIR